jgi:hypothetical protein
MAYKLTVKVSKEVHIWFLFADGRPVAGFNKDGEVLLGLTKGEHRLSYQITGEGGTIALDLEGRPPIIVPDGKDWPYADEVPDGDTGTANAVYFEIRQ